jgi:putative Holliday junction resolvase
VSRVLALDYGRARCGCAVSDPTGTIATPIEPVLRPRSKRGLAEIVKLVSELQVDVVLVGLPLSLKGGETMQTRETRQFAGALERRLGCGEVDVVMYDERFTTKLAAVGAAGRSSEDSRAAAHLLQSWLARAAGEQAARQRAQARSAGRQQAPTG